jgi:hypothetical protein
MSNLVWDAEISQLLLQQKLKVHGCKAFVCRKKITLAGEFAFFTAAELHKSSFIIR